METPHISNIESFFDNHYAPANHIGMADTIVSTKQLYDALSQFFHSKNLLPKSYTIGLQLVSLNL